MLNCTCYIFHKFCSFWEKRNGRRFEWVRRALHRWQAWVRRELIFKLGLSMILFVREHPYIMWRCWRWRGSVGMSYDNILYLDMRKRIGKQSKFSGFYTLFSSIFANLIHGIIDTVLIYEWVVFPPNSWEKSWLSPIPGKIL